MKDSLLASSFKELKFTVDPLASTVEKSANDAVAAGLSKEYDLTGLFDLSLLNQILKADGKPQVQGL